MRYEAKLFLAFDAATEASAELVLNTLLGAMMASIDEVSQLDTLGATLALDDAMPYPVDDD